MHENPTKGIQIHVDSSRINHVKHISADQAKEMILKGELMQGVFKVHSV